MKKYKKNTKKPPLPPPATPPPKKRPIFDILMTVTAEVNMLKYLFTNTL